MTKLQRQGSQSGFTLVELSIGLLLTGILMAGLFGLLSSSLESRTRGGRSMELQQTARYAIDLMVRELQYANQITVDSSERITFTTEQFGNKTITYSRSRDTADSPWILRRNQNDGSGALPVTGGGKTVNVSISALEFRRLKPVGAADTLTVGIEITVTDLAVSDTAKRPSYTLRTAVTGMNIPR